MPESFKDRPEALLSVVGQTVSDYRMFCPGDRVLVGVSGGADSVALIRVLHQLAPVFPMKLGVAHLDHGLRQPEAQRDARFVACLSEELSLPFFVKREDVGAYCRQKRISVEEGGRILRYRFFEETAESNGFDKIALGHHADDNAESILMGLIRGTGPVGLAGIPPVRDGRIVRPLIRVGKSELIHYLKQMDHPFVEDESNRDAVFLRNRIRHHLLPLLRRDFQPKITECLNRFAVLTRDEEEWIEAVLAPLFAEFLADEGADWLSLRTEGIEACHAALKRRLIRKALSQVKGDLRQISFTHVESVLRLLDSHRGSGRLHLPRRILVERQNRFLRISRKPHPLRESAVQPVFFEYEMDGPGQLEIPEIRGVLRLSESGPQSREALRNAGHRVAFFDKDTLSFPLLVRSHRPGDRFMPLGMRGTQKLQDFFTNNRISRQKRAGCPVVVCRGQIVWVAGYRIGDSVKVTPSTRAVLKGELSVA